MRKYAESPAHIAQRAAATRKARREAGLYQTDEQKAAFNKFMRGESLSVEDMQLLASNPTLLPMQRQRFSQMSQAA